MDALTHKCPNCSGPLLFEPKDQKFHCPYCLSVFTEAEVTTFEQQQAAAHVDLEQATQTTEQTFSAEEQAATMSAAEKEAFQEATGPTDTATDAQASAMDLFSCPNCGAQIVTDATTAATYCYYCHNPVVLEGRLSGKWLPDKVLPFQIEKEEATASFLKWARKKFFVPRDFFDQAQIEKLTGVYFPYWSVDTKLSGQLSGVGTSVRVWRVGDTEYTETKQFQVQRRGAAAFKDLITNALSKNTQQRMVETVQPFDLAKAKPFKSQYLAGFQAEKRDIEFLAIEPQVTREVQSYMEKYLRNSAGGYTSLNQVQTNYMTDDQAANYVLLPVWLVTYRANNDSEKTYYYAMNGQTGKVSGILPLSYKRLGFVAGLIFLVVLILGLLGGAAT